MNRLLCLCLTPTLLPPAMLFFQFLAPAFAESAAPTAQAFIAIDVEVRAERTPRRFTDATERERPNHQVQRPDVRVALAPDAFTLQVATESGRRK